MIKNKSIVTSLLIIIYFMMFGYLFIMHLITYKWFNLLIFMTSIVFLYYLLNNSYNKIQKVAISILFTSLLTAFTMFNQLDHDMNNFSIIASTTDFNKAVKIQKYLIDKVDEASINIFDNKYWIKINADVEEYDDLLIELADSTFIDNSITLGTYFERSNIKNIALKRFEQSFKKRIEKIDGVNHVTVKVNIVQNFKGEVLKDKNTILINVDVLDGANTYKIKKIISNLVPFDEQHKIINIHIIE